MQSLTMMARPLSVWDVVRGRGELGEGQVVEIIGSNARVYFPDMARLVRQADLTFVRSGVPKEFRSPKAPVIRRKSTRVGSRKYPAEYGKEQLKSRIAEGMKISPVITKAYAGLIKELIEEIGDTWYFRNGFHAQAQSKKSGNLRNCIILYLNLKGDENFTDGSWVDERDFISIYICHAEELPEVYHKKFKFQPKGYHGQDDYVARIRRRDISKLSNYLRALRDTIKMARLGHS